MAASLTSCSLNRSKLYINKRSVFSDARVRCVCAANGNHASGSKLARFQQIQKSDKSYIIEYNNFKSKLHSSVFSHWNTLAWLSGFAKSTSTRLVRAVNIHHSHILPNPESPDSESPLESNSASSLNDEEVPSQSRGRKSRRRRSHEPGYEYALSLWRLGGHFREQAAIAFESFLNEEPTHSLAWVSYSRLIMDLKGHREARRVLFRALQTAGKDRRDLRYLSDH